MSIFIASFILLSMGMAIALLLHRKLAETTFLSAALVIGILYIFGLLNREGSLLFGICLLLFLTCLAVVYVVFVWIKQRKKIRESEIVSGVLIYLGFLIIALLLSYDRVFQMWDEFTHWGFTAKHFFYMDALGTVFHPYYDLWVPNYLPGTTLIQYFFARFSHSFIEFHTYIGMKMLYFAMMMPFMKDIFKKQKFFSRFFLLTVFLILPLSFSLSPYFIPTFYGSLYVDIIMGLLFGLSIIYYYSYNYETSGYGILIVSSATFVLAVTKDMGMLLSFGVSVIVIIDILCFRRSQVLTYIKNKNHKTSQIIRGMLLLLPLLLSIFIHFSWSNLLRRADVLLNAHVPVSLEIRNFFTGDMEHQQLLIRRNFWDAMFQREVPYFQLSTFWFSVIFAILLIIFSFAFLEKQKKWRVILGGMCLGVGFYIYKLIFAILYVFTFHYVEGLRLSSFERYMATYMLGMVLYLLMVLMLAPECLQIKDIASFKRVKVAIFVFVGVSMFGWLIFVTSSEFNVTIRERVDQPEHFRPRPTAVVAARWGNHFAEIPPYFIDQGGMWVNIRKMRYELLPHARLANVVNDYNIQVEAVSPSDGRFVTTPKAWMEHIIENGYERVYVFRSDEILEKYFGHFFVDGVQEDMLFDVVEDEGTIWLVPVVREE